MTQLLGDCFRHSFSVPFTHDHDPVRTIKEPGDGLDVLRWVVDDQLLQVLAFLLDPVLEDTRRIVRRKRFRLIRRVDFGLYLFPDVVN